MMNGGGPADDDDDGCVRQLGFPFYQRERREGAIRQWVESEDLDGKSYDDKEEEEADVDVVNENLFCVVDLHAITVPQEPGDLQESTLASATLYLATAIDPTKSRVFVQSHVSAHAELAWLLNCATPVNWLERMIQYTYKK